jgi:hypothetical protein
VVTRAATSPDAVVSNPKTPGIANLLSNSATSVILHTLQSRFQSMRVEWIVKSL